MQGGETLSPLVFKHRDTRARSQAGHYIVPHLEINRTINFSNLWTEAQARDVEAHAPDCCRKENNNPRSYKISVGSGVRLFWKNNGRVLNVLCPKSFVICEIMWALSPCSSIFLQHNFRPIGSINISQLMFFYAYVIMHETQAAYDVGIHSLFFSFKKIINSKWPEQQKYFETKLKNMSVLTSM